MPGLISLTMMLRQPLLLAALCFVPATALAEWSVDGTGGCALETGETSIFDGYQDTTLKLSVTDAGLLVRTESNIDMGFADVGLAVDGGEFMSADTVVDERHVLFSKHSDAILEKFVRGQSVKLYLRFWPSYPATQRYEASFSLIGFTRAHNDYRDCREQPPA